MFFNKTGLRFKACYTIGMSFIEVRASAHFYSFGFYPIQS